jgi:hypothetical protein
MSQTGRELPVCTRWAGVSAYDGFLTRSGSAGFPETVIGIGQSGRFHRPQGASAAAGS